MGKMTYQEQMQIAVDRSASPHMLERLSRSKYKNVRCGVADNPYTPGHVLERLSGDSYSLTRQYVAKNKSTRPEILTRLADDEDDSVRFYVAHNKNAPKEARFAIFLEHPEWVEME